MSGEVEGPFVGTLVGVLVLRNCIWLSMHRSAISAPLAAALLSEVAECQAGSCALKSPPIRVSSVKEKRPVRSGE